MAIYLAAALFISGCVIDALVIRAFYLKVHSYVKSRRPVQGLQERIEQSTRSHIDQERDRTTSGIERTHS